MNKVKLVRFCYLQRRSEAIPAALEYGYPNPAFAYLGHPEHFESGVIGTFTWPPDPGEVGTSKSPPDPGVVETCKQPLDPVEVPFPERPHSACRCEGCLNTTHPE